jgi:hypothetical protein
MITPKREGREGREGNWEMSAGSLELTIRHDIERKLEEGG